MVAYFETASEGDRQFEYVVWIILNRFADGTYESVDDLIWSGQYHIVFGDPDVPPSERGGILTSFVNNYPNATREEIARMAYDHYKSQISDRYVEIAEGVRNAYNSGEVDPTRRAKFFAHVDTFEEVQTYTNNLTQRAMYEHKPYFTMGFLEGNAGRFLLFDNLYWI